MSIFAQDTPTLHQLSESNYKNSPFSHSKEKDLENKNYLINHRLTYIFCLSFISRTRMSAPGQQEACMCCAISTLTAGDTW